ncbi:hypothetical protein SAMN05518856_10231 [Paenibacillus sp. OK003]|nr:hypothetical protein SAMN05518856_10231 [Paenibacillus sp. OK003]
MPVQEKMSYGKQICILRKPALRTVLLFPVLYLAAYLLVFYAGSYFIPMIIMVFVWGAIHSGGLIISQT